MSAATDETRTIEVKPAFHRCAGNPRKNYGISDPHIVWTLHVGADAITWHLFTGWGMPEEAFHDACPDCTHPRHRGEMPSGEPTGGAVDWHMSTPVLDDHCRVEHCYVLDGPCYGDVGYLIGDVLFDLLRVEGSDAVWAKLRELLVNYRAEVAEASA